MLNPPIGEWTMDCDPLTFAKLKNDREFHLLVTLGRCISVVKFNIDVATSGGRVFSPSMERRRTTAYYSLAGALHEISELVDRLAHSWSNNQTYAPIFRLFDESQIDKATSKLLNKVRNRAAFHLDQSIPGRVLPTFPDESFTFLSAIGNDTMNSNYELADLVWAGFLFEASTDMHRLQENFLDFLKQVSDLADLFLDTTESIVVGRLLAIGFKIIEFPDGTFASDRTTDSGEVAF